eukprot:gene23007-29807_t
MFVGWEGVGLSSYLLINFWFTRIQANKSSIKAMLINRVGDFFILLGAMGKSAQLGLHTWLPDAMEGPTPVSALIHAATMVTAGYMVFACGLSSYDVAMFHLSNHAFFKALLFLGAGSVIHAVFDEQDLRSLSLVGFPFMSGFYSKDCILELAFAKHTILGHFAYYFGLLGVASTALIFSGFLTKDLMIGVGSGFFSDSIFVSEENYLHGDIEFISIWPKLAPLVLTLLERWQVTIQDPATPIAEGDLGFGSLRLLEVDNRVVLPIKTHIRLLISSSDVLHSWAVPSFGIKIDACPGRLSQGALFIKRQGIYYGQCSEICGVNHGFMPIVVKAVSPQTFLNGVIIFFLMMAAAFMGYVLPWGQMSFWGATVITNLFSAIPYIGKTIVEWLWGGFSVNNATLNRFLSLHYLVPFLIVGHPDNYIVANSLVTPPHIVPEWYFLPFYAILRSIPSKLGGVLAMGFAIIILAFLPLMNKSAIRSAKFRPVGWVKNLLKIPILRLGLSIAGNCRMCLVYLDLKELLVVSCVTPIADDMVITCSGSGIEKARESIIEFLLLNHPLDCPICDQGGECDLQDQAKNFGGVHGRLFFNKCVRFNSEVVGFHFFSTLSRGGFTEIGTYYPKILDSEISGNVIDLCPVGALTAK